MTTPALPPLQRRARGLAAVAWCTLLALCVLWELWLAPQRPGGSWLVLKALPLLLLLRGVLKTDLKTLQWAVMLVLLYVAEGAVRVLEPQPHRTLAAAELLLALGFFLAAIVYLRPFKQAAKERKRAEAAQRS